MLSRSNMCSKPDSGMDAGHVDRGSNQSTVRGIDDGRSKFDVKQFHELEGNQQLEGPRPGRTPCCGRVTAQAGAKSARPG